MRIRTLQAGDVPAVAALTRELGYDVTEAEVRKRFSNLVTDTGHGLFVADEAGSVIGWIHIHSAVALQDRAWGEIRALVVAEERRGTGIGKALVSTAEAWASRQGYASVRVRSREARRAAHAFYQSVGYQILKTSLTFEKQLTD